MANDSKIIETQKFIKILSDSGRITAGGDEFEAWADDLLGAFLDHRDILRYGGVVVPQVGRSSGSVLQIHLESLTNVDIDINKYISIIYDNLAKGVTTPSLEEIYASDGSKKTLVYAPIVSSDKPIGYFWVIVDDVEGDNSFHLLNYVSIIASLAITSNKLFNAINLLAQPIWTMIHDPERLAEYAASLCLEALGCRSVIMWKRTNRNMLVTMATAGQDCAELNFDMVVGEGLAGKCAATGKFMTIDNLQAHIDELAHPEVVQEYGFYSAMFAPLDLGGEVGGVFAVYAARPNAFSNNDENITKAIVHLLSTSYVHSKRNNELAEIEKKLNLEAPAIETGLLALERIHDANNQLAFAQNSLNFILDKSSRDKNSFIYKHANEASEHINQAKKTINALARRAKLDDIKKSRTNIKLLLNDVMTGLCNELNEGKVKHYINCPDNIIINLDQEQMTRVLNNIIGNSIYFINTVSRDGKIEINVVHMTTSIEIRIRDNGPGIATNEIGKVFNMFYTSKGRRGMGFGLAIARRIVEQHKGIIRVKSEWGSYTEFKINLPL